MTSNERFEKKIEAIERESSPKLIADERELEQLKEFVAKKPDMVTIPEEENRKVQKRISFLAAEINNLKDTRKKRLATLYRRDNLIAPTLEKLGKKRKKIFKKEPKRSSYSGAIYAESKDEKEIAYHCSVCGWIIGGPQIEIDRSDTAERTISFCKVCKGRIGGALLRHCEAGL